jgi:hypothetical protein
LASAKILAAEMPRRIDELRALCLTAMEGVEISGPNGRPLGHSREPIARVGDRYAGIDVGSRGVKFVMLEVADRGGVRVPTILTGKDNEDEVKNSGLNDSAALTQKYSQEALEATVDAVKKFVEKARNRGVPDDHIFVVGSSGLARAANREELKTLVRRATQAPGHKELEIGFIGHQDEVGLTFLDVVPQGSRDTSFVLDIGSGNTKFGYAVFSADKKWTGRGAQLSYATATFRDRAKIGCRFTKPADPLQSAVEFADQAKAVRGELKIDQALEIEEAKVDLAHRPRLYLSGGIVWALVTILKPDQVGQAEVPVTKADIQKFREFVRKPTDQIFAAVNFKGVAPAEQDQARQELLGKNGVQKVFASYTEKDPKNPDKKIPYPVPHADLIAGAEILDAVANTLDFDHLEVIFPRKAKDAWIRSYVLFEADFKHVDQQP